MTAPVLWLIPPLLLLTWAAGRFNLSLSDFEVWLFGGAGIMVYTWLLLLLVRGVDAVRRKPKRKSNT